MPDRLTGRTDDEIRSLLAEPASALTFNELLALAARRIDETKQAGRRSGCLGSGPVDWEEGATTSSVDFLRDLALAHTALEDALTRYNSACYRRAGTWKRADPDRR